MHAKNLFLCQFFSNATHSVWYFWQWLMARRRCDGRVDCREGEDETNCRQFSKVEFGPSCPFPLRSRPSFSILPLFRILGQCPFPFQLKIWQYQIVLFHPFNRALVTVLVVDVALLRAKIGTVGSCIILRASLVIRYRVSTLVQYQYFFTVVWEHTYIMNIEPN